MLPKGPFAFYSLQREDLIRIRTWMHAQMDEDEASTSVLSADGRCLIGVLRSGKPQYPANVTSASDRTCIGVVDGVLFDACPWDSKPHELALRNADEIGGEANGMFAAAAYAEDAITLLTDPWGTLPMHVLHTEEHFAAASSIELLAVWKQRIGRLERDPAGLAQLLSFGTILDGRTIFRGIRKMGAAELLRVSLSEDRPPQRVTYYIPTVAPRPYPGIEHDIRESFHAAVLKVVNRGVAPLAATLSGGLDSRVIAAVIADAGIPLRVITHFTQEGHDIRIARDVAARLALTHDTLRLPSRFRLDGAAAAFVSATNTAVSLDNLHALLTYRHCGEHAATLIDGNHTSIEGRWFLRNTAHRAGTKDRFFEQVRALLRRDSLLAYAEDPETCQAEADERLHALIPDPSSHASPGCAADVFWVRHILPYHGTDLALMQNHFIRYLSPYLDRDYVDVISMVPERHRWMQRPQYEILRRFAPQLMRVPRCYTDVLTWSTANPYLLRVPVALERLYARTGMDHRWPDLHRRLSRRASSVRYDILLDANPALAGAACVALDPRSVDAALSCSAGRIRSDSPFMRVLPLLSTRSLFRFLSRGE